MKGSTAASAALCALLGGSPSIKRCHLRRQQCHSDGAKVASPPCGHQDVTAYTVREELPVDDKERRRIVETGILLLGSSAVSPGQSCFAEEGFFSGVTDSRLADIQPFENDDRWV